MQFLKLEGCREYTPPLAELFLNCCWHSSKLPSFRDDSEEFSVFCCTGDCQNHKGPGRALAGSGEKEGNRPSALLLPSLPGPFWANFSGPTPYTPTTGRSPPQGARPSGGLQLPIMPGLLQPSPSLPTEELLPEEAAFRWKGANWLTHAQA